MNTLYRFVKFIGSPLFKILYRPTVINKNNIPKNGRIVLAGNHTSNLDCALLISSNQRIIHFLAKKELHNSLLGKWFFSSMGTIPVDRSRKNPNAMQKAIEILNQDSVIGIFPEGTTNKKEGQLLPFKYGAVSLAKKTDSYLVPFSIRGKYRLFKKNITIEYGKPYKIKNDDLVKENEILQKKVIKLLKQK